MACKEVTEITDVYGGIGTYQIISLVALIFNEALIGILAISPVFMFPEVTMHWDWDNATTYFSGNDCQFDEILQMNKSSKLSNSSSRIIYKSHYSSNTLTEKYGLVCEKFWLVSLTKSYSSLGTASGCLLVGRLTERFGRRKLSLILLCVVFVSNLCIQFSNSFVLYSIACVVNGISVVPAYSTLVVQVLENVVNSRRAALGTLGRYGMIVGQAVITGVSWAIRDWYYTQTFIVAFGAVCIPLAWYIVDSPVWLMVKGRAGDANKNAMIIAKRNGQDLQEAEKNADLWIETMKEKNANRSAGKGKIVDLFKNKVISKYTILITLASMLMCVSLNGVMFNLESFGSDLYMDFLISSGTVVIGMIVATTSLTKFSIKKFQIACVIFAGVNMLIYVFTYSFPIARTVTSAVIRGTLTAASSCNLTYATEIFPTSVRLVGTAILVLCLKLANAISPFIRELGEKTLIYVPYLLLAILLFLSAIMLGFLPETKNRPLIHNVDDLIKKPESETKQTVNTVESRAKDKS